MLKSNPNSTNCSLTEELIMWEEIQDMPGEIFDIKEEDWMAVFDDSPEEDFDKETKKLLAQF